METLLFAKLVDKSTLYEGISIPIVNQKELFNALKIELKKGEKAELRISIDGILYNDATLRNQFFDTEKYQNRTDIVQIRYSSQSALAMKIREKFPSTLAIVENYYAQERSSRKQLIIPENKREYIIIYNNDGVLKFDCVQRAIINTESEMVNFGVDNPEKVYSMTSAFKRNEKVAEQVKKKANGICQLCGKPAPFIDENGKPYLEIHHIVWLSQGGADKVSNAVALCPNCHRKMHVIKDDADIKYLKRKAENEI